MAAAAEGAEVKRARRVAATELWVEPEAWQGRGRCDGCGRVAAPLPLMRVEPLGLVGQCRLCRAKAIGS